MGLPSGTFARTYTQDTAVIRTRTQWWLFIGGLILVSSLPMWLPRIPVLGTDIAPLEVLNYIGIYIIAVMGLQIMMGYCGQLSLGHAAFMAVGAYTSGLLVAKLGVPFLIALPCAALAAGLAGVIFGASALRLRGFYMVASTLAAQFVILWAIYWWAPVTGGDAGFQAPRPSIASFSFNTHARYYYIIMAFVLLGTFFARNLVRTRVGRAFIAIRDNELAANVMGIRLVTTKLLAFFIGCAYAGVAGALWMHWQGNISPELFNLWTSIWFVGYLIVGGMGTTIGPFIGVIVIELFSNGMSSAVIAVGTPTFAPIVRDLLFGLVIILFLLFEPKGLAHRWNLLKLFYRQWPYAY